jgi:hypothetical protein
MNKVPKANMQRDNPAVGEGKNGYFAGDIRVDRAGDLQSAGKRLCGGLHQRKARGIFYDHGAATASLHHRGRGGSFVGRICFVALAAGCCQTDEESQTGDEAGRCHRPKMLLKKVQVTSKLQSIKLSRHKIWVRVQQRNECGDLNQGNASRLSLDMAVTN